VSAVAREQFRLSLALLAALALACLGVALSAHFSPVMPRYIAWQLELHRQTNGQYHYDAGYADAGDYVVVGQILREDFSRGGVYFIGPSNMMVSIMPWELPPGERRLIRNYAMGDLNHRETRHLFESLVEELNFLQAGGKKTTVFLGLFYGCTREKHGRVIGDNAVPFLFRRHNLFTYDAKKGIHLVPMWSVVRFLRQERIYANRFLRILLTWPNRVRPAIHLDLMAARKLWTHVMGPDWQKDMEDQVGHLAALLDYLQSREVRVQAIFLPYPSFHDDLPFPAAYREKVMPILQARKVPVWDYSHFLPDEEFADATHCRYTGQRQVHEVYRKLALRALEEMGATMEP
jgi:hypothetical protein